MSHVPLWTLRCYLEYRWKENNSKQDFFFLCYCAHFKLSILKEHVYSTNFLWLLIYFLSVKSSQWRTLLAFFSFLFILIEALLRYYSQAIQSMVFATITTINFIIPKTSPVPISNHTPFFSNLQGLDTTNLFSISTDLPILNISHNPWLFKEARLFFHSPLIYFPPNTQP